MSIELCSSWNRHRGLGWVVSGVIILLHRLHNNSVKDTDEMILVFIQSIHAYGDSMHGSDLVLQQRRHPDAETQLEIAENSLRELHWIVASSSDCNNVCQPPYFITENEWQLANKYNNNFIKLFRRHAMPSLQWNARNDGRNCCSLTWINKRFNLLEVWTTCSTV